MSNRFTLSPAVESHLFSPPLVQWVSVSPLTGAASWFAPSIRNIAKLGELHENWDGYRSPRIKQAAMDSARSLLRSIYLYEINEPEIFPVTGGGVGVTFQS